MPTTRRILGVLLLFAASACGGTETATGMPDARPQGEPPPDAAVPVEVPDAPPRPPSSPAAMELTSAGGRMNGGGYVLDFEIGQAIDQGPAGGGGFRLEGVAVVTQEEGL